MTRFALVAVALAASGCPAPIPLDCLPCDADAGDAQCAPDGLACVKGFCEGATPCTAPDSGPPQILFADDFETGTLLKSETPAGQWDDKVMGQAAPDETIGALQSAALGGQYGLSLKDMGTATDESYNNGWYLYSYVDAGSASSLHLRYHAKLTSPSGKTGPFPIELHSDDVSVRTVAEMALAGSGVAGLKCGGVLNPDAPCVTQGHFTLDTWHTVRISMEGMGQLGSCSWWLDDELVCSQPVDWRVTRVDHILGAAPALNLSWHGELSMDDVTLSQEAPPPHRLYLAGPVRAVVGRCTAFSLQTEERLLPVKDIAIAISGAHAFSDAACATPATGLTLATGQWLVPLWLRFDEPGDATVTATDVGSGDVLPGTRKVSVAAPSGCGVAPGAPLIALALVASMRRRTRRVV